jgi:hypothetical protein
LWVSYNNVNISKLIIEKKIQTNQILNIEMEKKVYTTAAGMGYISSENIMLADEEIDNIVSWVNSVSESDILVMNQMPKNTSISTGIVLKLKFNKEIRIQYDLETIYITRTDIKGKRILYSIEQNDLKSFFDEKLQGFYFGEDTVQSNG